MHFTMQTERHKFWIHSMILYLDWLLTRQVIGTILSLKLILLAISARDRAESIASGTLFQRLSTHFFIHFPPNAKFWKILSTASKMWHVGSVAIISFMDNFNHFDKNVYFKTLLFLQRVQSDFGLSCLMSVAEEETYQHSRRQWEFWGSLLLCIINCKSIELSHSHVWHFMSLICDGCHIETRPPANFWTAYVQTEGWTWAGVPKLLTARAAYMGDRATFCTSLLM